MSDPVQKKIYLSKPLMEAVEKFRSAQRPIPTFTRAVVDLLGRALTSLGLLKAEKR